MFRLGHLVVALSEAWLVPVFLIFLHKEISTVVMDDFKISKLDRFRFDFLKKI